MIYLRKRVSIKRAEQLKKLGFREPCDSYSCNQGVMNDKENLIDWNSLEYPHLSIPTIKQANKWLKNYIIDKSVEHVCSQGRAVDEHKRCQYLTEEGKLCNHSFFIKPEKRVEVQNFVRDNGGDMSDSHSIINKFGDSIHQEAFQDIEPEFWKDIQVLHDRSENWMISVKSGKKLILSQIGQKRFKTLKERINQEPYSMSVTQGQYL